MNLLDQHLGQLARDIPGVTDIFYKYNLDFYCGGKQSLRTAAMQQALNIDALLAELSKLQALPSTETRWAEIPDQELIDHILIHYHDTHRDQFPNLIRLAHKVEQAHRLHPRCPNGLVLYLEKLEEDLDQHMQREEATLFPAIIRKQGHQFADAIAVMRQEHDEHGQVLALINELTRELTLPEDADDTWRALYFGLRMLKADLVNHIHLENNILFNRIDKQFGSPDSAIRQSVGCNCGANCIGEERLCTDNNENDPEI